MSSLLRLVVMPRRAPLPVAPLFDLSNVRLVREEVDVGVVRNFPLQRPPPRSTRDGSWGSASHEVDREVGGVVCVAGSAVDERLDGLCVCLSFVRSCV